MRNLLAYPVTSREVIECLERLAKELNDDQRIGDMRPILLETAAAIVHDHELTGHP